MVKTRHITQYRSYETETDASPAPTHPTYIVSLCVDLVVGTSANELFIFIYALPWIKGNNVPYRYAGHRLAIALRYSNVKICN